MDDESENNSRVISNMSCPSFDLNDQNLLDFTSFWLEGVTQSSFAILGIVANLTSCYILTRKSMKNAFNLLLVTLASFDCFYLLGAILESFRFFKNTSFFRRQKGSKFN